ncbi:hypothetical protein KM043_008964 [Ampulex compressa]|nr:hypothetical protein KM043_008964 [Ampulex compressa]
MQEITEKTGATIDEINHRIMDILNPSLHHHDLLQSYVRAPADEDSKQTEDIQREVSIGDYPEEEEDDDTAAGLKGRSKRNTRWKTRGQEKPMFHRNSVETEMKIQKSNRR